MLKLQLRQHIEVWYKLVSRQNLNEPSKKLNFSTRSNIYWCSHYVPAYLYGGIFDIFFQTGDAVEYKFRIFVLFVEIFKFLCLCLMHISNPTGLFLQDFPFAVWGMCLSSRLPSPLALFFCDSLHDSHGLREDARNIRLWIMESHFRTKVYSSSLRMLWKKMF